MAVRAYTRVSDLGALPSLVTQAAGARVLARICHDQDVPIAILDHPDAMLLYRDWLGLFQRGALVTGERCIGLRIGSGLGISDLGLFGQYVASAPDLKQALVRGVRDMQFHESFSTVDIAQDGDDIKFSYRSVEQGGGGWRHAADMVLCVMVDIVRQFTGNRWSPKAN